MEPSDFAGTQAHHAWILVAGTGTRWGLPQEVTLASAAVGEAVARFGCGLVTGGWPGVDYIAADRFATTELEQGVPVAHRLVQVVREDREIEFPQGRIVRTKPGPLEWLEPQAYCDAVVLIGGVGGTYGTFLSALHKGLPRFPLGGTGGDAAQAFQHMCELWDVMPNPGIAKSQFETLGRPVANPEDARTLANELVPLVINSVLHRNGRKPKSIFVSYSRSDEEWMRRVVATLQPIEQSGRATIWTDIHIEAGSQWDVELRRSLSTCDVAVLLVSPSFIQSGYVQDVELPVLVERAKAKRTKVLWVALSESAWETTELRNTQAVLNPRQPLDRRSSAEVQVALVKLRQTVDKSIAGMDR